jgi:glycosyltransferase involved in cell wall biosynthesis
MSFSSVADPQMCTETLQPSVDALGSIAIVIPCFQVARHIADVIRSIPQRYRTIICVDDCSRDATADVILQLSDPRVTLICHRRNRGVGGAVKTGYLEALRRGAGICVKMDGDGQMSGDDLDDLVTPLLEGAADYAKGNRFVDLWALRRMPKGRLVGNALLSFASKLASGYWNMLDVNNGFTAIRSAVLRHVEFGRLSERYFFETSMLIELNILRSIVADVEMPARYGTERSSLRTSRVLLTFPGLLARGMLRRLYWRYLIEDFGVTSICVLTGLPLVAFGVAFGAMHWIASIRTGRPATAGTVLLAALPIILGFQLLLAAVLLDVVSSTARKQHRRGSATAEREVEHAAFRAFRRDTAGLM